MAGSTKTVSGCAFGSSGRGKYRQQQLWRSFWCRHGRRTGTRRDSLCCRCWPWRCRGSLTRQLRSWQQRRLERPSCTAHQQRSVQQQRRCCCCRRKGRLCCCCRCRCGPCQHHRRRCLGCRRPCRCCQLRRWLSVSESWCILMAGGPAQLIGSSDGQEQRRSSARRTTKVLTWGVRSAAQHFGQGSAEPPGGGHGSTGGVARTTHPIGTELQRSDVLRTAGVDCSRSPWRRGCGTPVQCPSSLHYSGGSGSGKAAHPLNCCNPTWTAPQGVEPERRQKQHPLVTPRVPRRWAARWMPVLERGPSR